MEIKKINQDVEIDVTIKKVRLPSLAKKIEELNECEYIDFYSFSYGRGGLFHAFFKEFTKDEEKMFSSYDDKYQPAHGNELDCNGVIDIIPIIEVEENLEVGAIYLAHNIPFIAATKNKLVCLTRTDYWMVAEDENLDLDEVCDYLDNAFNQISNW